MKKTIIVKTAITTFTLLTLAGSGCSDDKGNNNPQLAALCNQLDAKQAELDCKVAVLKKECASGDTACNTKKDADLQACSSATLSSNTMSTTSTSTGTAVGGEIVTRKSACAGMGFVPPGVGSASGTSTTTSTSSSTVTVTSN
jgi:hypothetical protein